MLSNGFFMCPNCGNQITETTIQVCPNCTYDFGQLIGCSYIGEDKECLLTGNPCNIKGLDFEDCSIYIGKFHENKLPEI